MSEPFRFGRTERLVGALVLAAAASAAGGVWLVGRARHWLEKPFEVPVLVDHGGGSGLRPGLPVRIQGRPAGEVVRLHRDGDSVLAVTSLHEGFREVVRRDSRALLHTPIAGFLGETFLEIVPGDGPEALGEGESIRFQASEDLMEQARQTIIRFGEAAEELRKLVAENRQGLGETVREVRGAAAGVNSAVAQNREALGRALVDLAALAAELRAAAAENREPVRQAIARLPAAVESAQGAGAGVGDAGRAVAEAARAIGPASTQVGAAAQELGTTAASTRDELKATLAALRDLSLRLDAIAADVQKVSRQVSEGKGTVGKLVMDDALHDKAVAAATKAEERLDEIKPLMESVTTLALAVGAEIGYDTHSGSGTGGIYVRIEPRPWKFMQAGASYRTAPEGRDISAGSDSSIPVDFNLALGWRWMRDSADTYYHLTAAGGLIENTLGAWVEVPLGHERVVWRTMGRLKHNDRDPNDRRYEEGSVLVRSTIELRTWRRLFLIAGCDDIAREPGPWVGLRGELYDNDLRNATGVASLFK